MVSEVEHSMVIESSSSAIAEAREWLLSSLKEHNFNKDNIFAVHLAFEEALHNAVQHGNKMDTKKKIKIDCLISSDKVELSITDEGSGFDPNSIPDCRCGENLYKTEGRGLLLIRSYMDVVEFNEKGDSLHMTKYKKTPKSNDKVKSVKYSP